MATADGFVERGSDGAVNLVDGCGLRLGAELGGLGQDPAVEGFEVLGLEELETVCAYPGDEVVTYGDAVRRQRRGFDVPGHDVVEPVREPTLNRPPGAGCRNRALLTVLLEPTHLLGHASLRRGPDVATVRSSVVANADGHTSMP